MKNIIGIYTSPRAHWVGDGFPVRTLFSYDSLGKHISPFLLLDHAGPRHHWRVLPRMAEQLYQHRCNECWLRCSRLVLVTVRRLARCRLARG